MTKLGAHVCTGERHGFSDFLKAKPRLVVGVGEGGALLEAKEFSGGHTTTIYRDMSVYVEAPGDINTLPEGITLAMAAKYWYEEHDNGGLRSRWKLNPADYYTITNEQGGSDPLSIRNLVIFEREIMKMANADGFKVCVLNQAGGSPGDFEMWKELLAPFILEAWDAGNIYGRHAYGFPDLVGQDGKVLWGNPYRPIKEIEYLNSLGAHGGMAIKECGLDGGFRYAGDERFYFQMTNYQSELAMYDDIIGIAMWNLGYWQASNANWQSSMPAFTAYMDVNPSAAYVPPEAGKGVTIKPPAKPVADSITAKPQAPAPTPGTVKGLQLTTWQIDEGRCDFRIHGEIWFKFHYANTGGRSVPYGGMGALVEKWDGEKLTPLYYQHSYAGTLKISGGPSEKPAWSDNWKPGDVGIFAFYPVLSFDNGATNKRDKPGTIADTHKMGKPIWVRVGSRIEPGGIIEAPAGAPEPVKPEPPPPPPPETKPDPVEVESGAGEEVSGYRPEEKSEAENLKQYIWQQGLENRLITLNPSAALQKVIFAHGFVPVSREFWTTYEGVSYACQMAENLQIGEKRVYYVLQGKWDQVQYLSNAPKRPMPEDFAVGGPGEGVTPEPVVEPEPEPVKPEFEFERWPTTVKKVNQYFAKNPEIYKKFNLPGHEGIDLASPMGTPYFAVAGGKVLRVSDQRLNGKPSAYGWHVLIDHGNGYTTLYAHATPDIPVKKGDTITAGQIVGFSGNTGNSSGPHLHLTVKKKGFTLPGWPRGYTDPWPFLEPMFNSIKPPSGDLVEGYLWGPSLEIRGSCLAITKLRLNMREAPDSDSRLMFKIKKGATVRLLTDQREGAGYNRCEASVLDTVSDDVEEIKKIVQPSGKVFDLLNYIGGDGRLYEVKNATGGQERFQTQWSGHTFYQTKNTNWEQFFFDNDFIYRDIDTSPGGERYYRLTDEDRTNGSRWARRKMSVGQIFKQRRLVQFYNDQNGAKISAHSGHVVDTIKLVAHYDEYTFRTGITLNDVVEMHWMNGGEKYFYAKDYGLVGWERIHFDPATPAWSAIAEIHQPGSREDNPRRKVAGV